MKKRRAPQQQRAHQTKDVILNAVTRVLLRYGVEAVTTNRIAEAAGVSIGSVYQYFPNKQAIFEALHERHLEDIGRIVSAKLIEHAEAPLATLLRALIDAMIEAHSAEPELHELLSTQVPHRADQGAREIEVRLKKAFHLAVASRIQELPLGRDLDRVLFVLPNMVESLTHAVVLRRPPGVSLKAAREETISAVFAYLGVAS